MLLVYIKQDSPTDASHHVYGENSCKLVCGGIHVCMCICKALVCVQLELLLGGDLKPGNIFGRAVRVDEPVMALNLL